MEEAGAQMVAKIVHRLNHRGVWRPAGGACTRAASPKAVSIVARQFVLVRVLVVAAVVTAMANLLCSDGRSCVEEADGDGPVPGRGNRCARTQGLG